MKILVVRLSSLGDVLHLFPAISDLRRHVPNAEIHWLVEPAFSELVRWHSAIDKVITIPLRSHKKIWWKIPALLIKLRQQLRAEKYNIVLDAQGLLKSAILARLAGNAVYGFAASSTREPLASWFYKKTAKVPNGIHVIEKNRQLVKTIFAADIEHPADFGLERFRRQQLQVELPESINEFTKRPYIVLLHGTTWNSKYWPEPYWKELIGLLEQQGWHCLLPWGNEDERLRAHRLLEAGNGHSQVLPKLALAELAGVLLRARAFISVETGIGHMADQLAEAQGPGERAGLVRHALHHAAVAHEHVGMVVDEVEFWPVEMRCEQLLGERHAHAVGDSLTERPGGGLHARRAAELGMARRLRAELAKALELVDRQVVAGQV